MDLTREQQKLFDGEKGEAARQSMEILVALGRIYGAVNLIPVSSVQVAGVSPKTIGDAGLEYLQDMVKGGAKVQIPTFLNPPGMDLKEWKKMGVPEAFAKKQLAVLDAFTAMGITPTCTCTPYLVGVRPKVGEHVAWSESSAVAFCNSVLGARTNREGGPSALAAGICGATPNYGYHLDENRVAGILIDVQVEIKTPSDFGALGAYVGEISKGKNVAYQGISKSAATEDRLKGLGAAMAAWGSNALYYMKNVTPEFVLADSPEKITVGAKELATMRAKLGMDDKPELVAIGCPHASIGEIEDVALYVKGKKLACALWVCTARQTKEKADKAGYTATIEAAGGKVVADTCMVVCPIADVGYSRVAVNSGKASKYLSAKEKVRFGDLKDIITFKK
ncbi:MAG: aconitase X catalytic domain-containing protein [Candidatus Micrarchaeota archaeon]|nr:aconitase X catalytic domain-containing protein [Candidatus Micrarchaeota archaeon]